MQLGMSKGGTEIAAKAISTHLELNPKWAAFKNDFCNAFNACARRRMVERLLKSPFGHFEPAFRLFYEHAGALYFEGERLPADSCEGAQQGDPLGPFIFALAFHATLQQVAAEYTDCVFVAYLDDVTVLGPPARAYAALQRLQSLAESQCDLESDMTKCGVFSPAATDAEMGFIPASIEGSPHYVGDKHSGRLRGMVFVGAPVGDDEWVAEELRFIFGKLVSRLPALARMRDAGRLQVAAQARTLLLRYCANPRAGFWLRMVPPHLVRRVAATFDDAIEACLRETVCSRGAPDDARWRRALKQARLPMRLGGLGLTSAAGQADAAWCGSWALCWSRMQRFFPALAAIDLTTAEPRAAAAAAAAAAPGEAAAPSPRLPSLVSLRDAHARLMARRDEVDTAFKGIDAAAAAVPVPRPGRRVPADLAYHPKGLPPAGALPSLTQMADPECKTNVRAQRSFASVAQLGSWLELMTGAAGLDGERCGVKVALRECSRLIGVAQPLASAWLQAIPGPSQFRLRSSLYVIALQRWLGLPIHMASAANVAAAETLGDELLKGCEHTTRHNRVVAAWVRAVQAARGAAHTRATAEAPAWSAPSVPDFVSEYAGQAGAHQVGEVKVYNTIISDAAQLLRGATQAFGATRARLLAENLGEFAPKDVVAPRSDGVPRTAKYQAALEGGHDVLVLISEVWGGFSPEAMRFLGELAQARNDGIDIERASTTWSTSSFTSYHGQLLSLAVQWGVAIEIERAIKKNASF